MFVTGFVLRFAPARPASNVRQSLNTVLCVQGALFMTSKTASCCCGQLQIEVSGDPISVGGCHCLSCQKDLVMVAVGAFGDPDFAAPEDSVYDCRRHPWVKIPKGVTVFEKDPP